MSRSRPPGGGDLKEEKRINVLFLMIQMAMGGSERLILNLVTHLDRRRFAPSVGWFGHEQPLREFQELNIPLYYIPKRSRVDSKTMRHVSRIIREHRIDIINAHHFMPFVYAYYGAKVANRCALVYTEHSVNDVLSAAGKWQTIGGYLARRADGIIGVSGEVSETLKSHFRLKRSSVHTIENGVDLDLFGNRRHDTGQGRERYGFGQQEVLIGHVANFRRNKNHLFLLEAFRDVLSRRGNLRLIFVGQGFSDDPENSEPEVRNYIRAHGLERQVSLLGYRSDVHDLLQTLDLFCLVSHKEGLPLSLIEAMSAGLPLIGTDIAGVRAVVEPEVNGLIVAPDDVSGLATALDRLIGDAHLRRQMGEASRQIARNRFALNRCVNQTQRLFLSIPPCAAANVRSQLEGVV